MLWLIVGFGTIALAGIFNQYLDEKRRRETKLKEIEKKLKAIEDKEAAEEHDD